MWRILALYNCITARDKWPVKLLAITVGSSLEHLAIVLREEYKVDLICVCQTLRRYPSDTKYESWAIDKIYKHGTWAHLKRIFTHCMIDITFHHPLLVFLAPRTTTAILHKSEGMKTLSHVQGLLNCAPCCTLTDQKWITIFLYNCATLVGQ